MDLILILILFSWFVFCNFKTRAQRLEIIESWRNTPGEQRLYFNEFGKVSYMMHLLYLVIFKNPYNLYSSNIRKAINKE